MKEPPAAERNHDLPPFFPPHARHVVSLSGGKDSGAVYLMALEMLDRDFLPRPLKSTDERRNPVRRFCSIHLFFNNEESNRMEISLIGLGCRVCFVRGQERKKWHKRAEVL